MLDLRKIPGFWSITGLFLFAARASAVGETGAADNTDKQQIKGMGGKVLSSAWRGQRHFGMAVHGGVSILAG